MHICDLNFYFITRKLTTFFFSTNGQHKKKNQLQSKTKQNKTFGVQVDVCKHSFKIKIVIMFSQAK